MGRNRTKNYEGYRYYDIRKGTKEKEVCEGGE